MNSNQNNMPATVADSIAATLRPCWMSDPVAFVSHAYHDAAGEKRNDFAETDPILDIPFVAFVETAGEFDVNLGFQVLGVAQAIADYHGPAYAYRNSDAGRFIRVGQFQFPASPAGVGALRTLRENARKIALGPDVVSLAPEDSEFRRTADALRKASGFVDSVKNATEVDAGRHNGAGYVQLGIRLERNSRLQATLPALVGSRIRSVLSPSVEGYEFEGSEIESWMSDAGACVEGTIEFLRRLGVDVEVEGESYECDECGHETEGEGTEIYGCADFTLDEKAIRMLDAAGYLDKTVEWISENGNGASGADSWAEFDSDNTAAEVLAQFGPTATEGLESGDAPTYAGVRFDVNVWAFTPDLEALDVDPDGDLEAPALLSLGAKLGALSDAYVAAGLLPPIPGRLVAASASYHGSDEVEFRWTPETGRLSTKIAADVDLEVDVDSDNSQRLVFRGNTRAMVVPLDSLGAFSMSKDSGGKTVGAFLRLACAEVAL